MDRDAIPEAADQAARLIANIEQVIVGKRAVVVEAVTAMLAGGHILLEDVPGVGKTMLAKAIARSVDGGFKRIQFTADLLPSDVTGVNIFQQQEGGFRFRPGPLFTNVLLADEINRATPRTQSSLLEAMEEYQVTVDGERHGLENPFFVIATQNPIELEGTYPLPFAQMDRFIVRLRLGYLDALEERRMIQARVHRSPLEDLGWALHCDDLIRLQRLVRQVEASEALLDYVVAVVRKTRHTERVEFGASPRASLDLMRYSQATALLHGRGYVLPDDVKEAAPPVLAHRLIVRRGARHAAVNTSDIISEILAEVEVPV